LQVADVVLGNIEAPAWVFSTILLILGLGFPLAMLFAVEAGVAVQQELLQQYGDAASYQQASIAAASGDADKTMEWLERGYEVRDPGLTAVKNDRDFVFLHDDPRFVVLLEKMNLAD
jgi:hypothetical protein